MTNDQFCYWLQGYFELRTNDDPLTDDQRDCVCRHASLCREHMKTRGGIGPTPAAIETLAQQPGHVCTPAIRALLDATFVHVIDPAAGDQQGPLDAIHGHPRC